MATFKEITPVELKAGAHVRITEHRYGLGPQKPYDVEYEGLVLAIDPTGQTVTIGSVDGSSRAVVGINRSAAVDGAKIEARLDPLEVLITAVEEYEGETDFVIEDCIAFLEQYNAGKAKAAITYLEALRDFLKDQP
jgi:hypothetical protein